MKEKKYEFINELIKKKTQFALELYTKSRFWAIWGSTIYFKRGVASKQYAQVKQIWSEKLHDTWKKKDAKRRGESISRRAKRREGGLGLKFDEPLSCPTQIYIVKFFMTNLCSKPNLNNAKFSFNLQLGQGFQH